MKKDREKHLAPTRKRNRNYFYMVTGSQHNSLRGHGSRSGGMVKGGMGARVEITTEELVQVSDENVRRHFAGIPRYMPYNMRFGDQSIIRKDQVKDVLNIEL